jgi:hypothetical protein
MSGGPAIEMIQTDKAERPVLNVSELGTVLAVWAHPDDEASWPEG